MYALFQVCNEVTSTEVDIVTKPQCKTITEEKCEPTYLQAYGKKCPEITVEECTPELVEVCEETEQKCTTVFENVPENKCTIEDIEQCEIINDEVCAPEYQTKCEPVTVQSCR